MSTDTNTPRTDDIIGNAQFYSWFTALFPKPKTKHQQSNWAYKRDTAHLGWCAAEAQHKGELQAAQAELTKARKQANDEFDAIITRNMELEKQLTALRAEVAAMREDKARLDWLEAKGRPGFGWMARNSTTGRGYRLHQDPARADAFTTARAAIDAARKEGA